MASSPPIGLRWRSSSLFIITTVAIGIFTDLFLYGIVVPILPFILESRVHLPEYQIQPQVSNLLAAYAGASVLFSPIAGWLADLVSSRQMPFLVGLATLFGATLLLSVGSSLPVLIVARVLQGTSGAVVWTVGLALLMDTVGAKNLGTVIGSIFSFVSVGTLFAPVLGGVLYDKAGDVGVFSLAGAVLIIDFIMRVLVIEKKVAAKYSNDQDDGNTGTEADGGEENTPNTQPDEESPLLNDQDNDGADAKTFIIPSTVPSWLHAVPILYPLRNPRLLTALLIAFVQALLLGTFDATIPTEAASLFHFTSLRSGLLFIGLDIPYIVLGPIAGRMVDRYGPKPAATFGYLFLVPVFVLLRLPHAGGTDQIALFVALIALCGAGSAVISSPSMVESSFVVEAYYKANPDFFGENGPYAQLYGLNSMVFSLGLTIGPLLSGGLRDRIGYGNMNAVLAGISLVTAVLAFVFVGGPPRLLRRFRR